MVKTKPKKVAFVIAPANFRDEEYFQPKVMLQAVGIVTDTIAKGDEAEITGSRGGKAHTTAKFADLSPQNYDGIVLVGGSGAHQYFQDKELFHTLNEFNNAYKPIAAICIAPVILANSRILTGKKATVFSEGVGDLLKNQVEYTDQDLVVDGNLITARDVSVAMRFGETIAKMVKNSA